MRTTPKHVKPRRVVLAIAVLLVAAGVPVVAQDQAPLSAHLDAAIADLDADISESEAAEAKYAGDALGAVAALNTEMLRLTRSVLEARKAAEETGAPIEIIVPAVEADPKLADEILADIQAQKKLVEEAKSEAEGAGGLMAAMALTRYETERLSLAQLRQAWYQAQYGIAFPTTGAPTAPQPTTAVAPGSDGTPADRAAPDNVPAWADPEHPEIDYALPIFENLSREQFEMIGWWGVQRSRAEVDDSPQVYALNVSDWDGDFDVANPSLIAACREGQARLVFDADDFLMSDFNSNTMPVTVRIGDDPAAGQRWAKLTTSNGAGHFGAPAEAMMRDLIGKEKLFLRLEETNGETHDLTIQLAGADRVFEEIATTCKFSLLDLGPDDYRAIQALLNAGGFDAGTPDGQWGAGSRAAMQRYQVSKGLAETGAPNRETLERMGIALDVR